jgi:hypothetical protein
LEPIGRTGDPKPVRPCYLPFQELPNLFEIFPKDLLFTGIAKNVGRVNGGKGFGDSEIIELAMYSSDSFLDPQDGLDRGRPQTADQSGLNGLELTEKER